MGNFRLLSCGSLLFVALTSAFAQTGATGLVLNEVLYFEDRASRDPNRSHEWLEIFNRGPGAVNLAGWSVSNRNGRGSAGARALPAIIMPVGTYLEVHFATGTNDYSFANGGGQHYTGDAAGINLFANLMDEAALYSPAQIVDFVAWNYGATGYTPGTAHRDAVAAGQWAAGTFLNVARIVTKPRDKFRTVLPGTSIGRDQDSTDTNQPTDWDAHGGKDASDITPGRQNLSQLNLLPIVGGGGGGPKAWTVMIYMNGDNSLERFTYLNLKQIEAAGGSDANVNVVVMVDGQHQLQQVTVDPNNNLVAVPGTLGRTWRFQVGPATDPRFVTMLNRPGDNPFLGERDMGDPAELSGFINWAKANYPAQKYGLVIWDHGAGWKGVSFDDSSPGVHDTTDALFMGELSTALAGNTFELLGFDACLMAMIEVAYQVQPFSRYMVGSQELEPGDGWPYDVWLPGLKANPGWNGAQLGARIVSDYGAHYSMPSPANPAQILDPQHTLSLIDQTQLAILVRTVSAFAVDLRRGADDFRTHDTPTDNVEHRIALDAYRDPAVAGDPGVERFVGDFNYMDLHDFTDRFNKDGAIPPCYKGQAPAVLAGSVRLGTVVLAETHGPNHPNANGLSIYMPLERTSNALGIAEDPYDDPSDSRVSDGNSQRALYAPNNDALPLQARDVETNAPLAAPAQWPLVPSPNFRFPADTQWDEFLMRFYHPVADNRIIRAINPDGSVVFPVSVVPACGNPVDEITVMPGATVFFSGVGSSDADTPNRLPLHWMWDFDHLTKGCATCVAPYEVAPGADAATANDDMDADHDATKAELTDEKEADGQQVSHVFCQEQRDYIVTLHAWDDNHTFPFHNTMPTARFVHPQTDDHISIVHCTPFEIDDIEASTALVEIQTPLGSEKVALYGPTTIAVDLSKIADTDGNGREQVNTEMTRLDLRGMSAAFGPVTLRLRSPSKSPFQRSAGQIEETVNTQSGRLDVPPFAPSGTAQSYFDVYFELEIPGAPAGLRLLHNQDPARMEATINFKPPGTGISYLQKRSVALFDDTDRAIATTIVNAIHIPQPETSVIPAGGVVNSASFTASPLAPGSIGTIFGKGFTSGTATVLVGDSSGKKQPARVFFASANQINFLVPAELAPGTGSLTIVNADGSLSTASTQIAAVAPGVFTANADGKGAPAALLLRIGADGAQRYEPVFACDPETRRCASRPLDAGAQTDQVFLILFGTGIRLRSALLGVTVRVGEFPAAAIYAGAQNEFEGLDQVNLRLPPLTALGHGEVPVVLTVDGKAANPVSINIR